MNDLPLDRFTAALDLREAISAWQIWLSEERRYAPAGQSDLSGTSVMEAR